MYSLQLGIPAQAKSAAPEPDKRPPPMLAISPPFRAGLAARRGGLPRQANRRYSPSSQDAGANGVMPQGVARRTAGARETSLAPLIVQPT